MTILIHDINSKEIILNRDKSHYLMNVLRCNVGDRIVVIDGKGRRYSAVINEIKNLISISIIDIISEDTHPYPTILCQSIIKGANMDLVIRQATELGVKAIYPVITERTIIRDTAKLNRWQKIAEEATEQSGRTFLPIIHEPIQLKSLLHTIDTQKDIALVFQKNAQRLNSELIKNFCNNKMFLFVGPEGDFSPEELSLMSETGCIKVSLGRFIMRADTAGIIAIAISHYYIDDCE